MAESEDMRQFRKLRELLAHINGQIEYIKNTLISAMYASFKSKYGSRLYKDKREELNAKWEEEHRKVHTLLKAYETQKNALTNVVKYILGGRAINSAIKGAIQAVANSVDNHLDMVLENMITVYPPRNTIPGNFASRHVARSRSRSVSPPRSRLQGQLKSAFINSKRHMRHRSKSRSPTRNASRNNNKNRNKNGNGNRKRTIRFNNRTTKYEIEGRETNNPFNNRSGVIHKTAEIKNMSRSGIKKLIEIYGNRAKINALSKETNKETAIALEAAIARDAKSRYRSHLSNWAKNKSLRKEVNKEANIILEASTAAADAAEEARRIVSTISERSPIFATIRTAADQAVAAARDAERYVHIADESFNDATSRRVARNAVAARDVALAALDEIRRTIADSPSAPAAAAAAASSNPQNRT
jgi:hypothetical protein